MSKDVATDDLRPRLEQAEAALEKCNRLAVASQYAGAMMHEVNNPLAAIANLVFLIKLQANDPKMVVEHADVIEKQLSDGLRACLLRLRIALQALISVSDRKERRLRTIVESEQTTPQERLRHSQTSSA